MCDNCGGPLVLREDDAPDAIRVRLKAYAENAAPLCNYRAGAAVTSLGRRLAGGTYARTLEALGSPATR